MHGNAGLYVTVPCASKLNSCMKSPEAGTGANQCWSSFWQCTAAGKAGKYSSIDAMQSNRSCTVCGGRDPVPLCRAQGREEGWERVRGVGCCGVESTHC